MPPKGLVEQPSEQPQRSILLLCDDNPRHANTVLDHIAAFRKLSKHHVRIFNPRELTGSRFLELDEFDVVVIHYSLVITSDHYLAPSFRKRLRRFQGLKIQFIQDDYRWIDKITAMMRYLGIHVLFTLVPPTEIPKVWDEIRLPGVVKLNTLAGYVPESLVGLQTPPIESRLIDIGYRGRIIPYWLGRLGQEKVWIGEGVLARAEKYGLRCDIAWTENDRIYGRRWNSFISSCKAILGTESGASITDFDESIERRVSMYLAEHPTADFFEVHQKILAPYEGNVRLNVISPKIFEAIALRTALILFPGDYMGIIQPWVHYIPLAKDFSNMDEVAEKVRDIQFLRVITERAYTDIVASGRYSYQTFIRQFDEVVERFGKVYGKRHNVRYQLSRLESKVRYQLLRVERAVMPQRIQWVKSFVALRVILRVHALRQLLLGYLCDRTLRKTMRLDQVLGDLLRLGIVRQAQTDTLTAGEPFRITVRFQPEEEQLILKSRCVDGNGSSDEPLWTTLESVLREGRVKTVIWDHLALGKYVSYRLSQKKCIRIAIGKHGIYRFDALAILAGRFPERTWAALSTFRNGVGAATVRQYRTCGDRL